MRRLRHRTVPTPATARSRRRGRPDPRVAADRLDGRSRGRRDHGRDSTDFAAEADEFHPTDSVYHDPIFGEIRGREAIRAWLGDIMGKVGNVVFEPLGPQLDDGTTSVQEWQQMALQPDGTRVFMTRGTSVRRRDGEGLVTYAADYFDTASLLDPDVQAAAHRRRIDDHR